MNEIKPCPWCGNLNGKDFCIVQLQAKAWAVQCKKCHARGGVFRRGVESITDNELKSGVWAAWNKRDG